MLLDDGHDGSTIDADNYSSYLLADVDSTQAYTTESAAADLGLNDTPATVVTLASETTTPAVPEPSSWLLLATGGLLLALVRLRWPRARRALRAHS